MSEIVVALSRQAQQAVERAREVLGGSMQEVSRYLLCNTAKHYHALSQGGRIVLLNSLGEYDCIDFANQEGMWLEPLVFKLRNLRHFQRVAIELDRFSYIEIVIGRSVLKLSLEGYVDRVLRLGSKLALCLSAGDRLLTYEPDGSSRGEITFPQYDLAQR